MEFIQLNSNWNADPNDDKLSIVKYKNNLFLSFTLNAFQFPRFKEGDYGYLLFTNVSKYRLGKPNDEAFYRRQFRYNSSHLNWGEFYEVIDGDGFEQSEDIVILSESDVSMTRHFIFFFKDYTFECYARDYKNIVDVDISIYCPYCKDILSYDGKQFMGENCYTEYSIKMSSAMIAMYQLAEYDKNNISSSTPSSLYCPKCKERLYYTNKIECSCKSCGLHFDKKSIFQLVELNPHNKTKIT